MPFTEVATGRMNCEGEKKVALEDSGRVILSQQSLAAKDKIDLLPGCATWEEETAQQWCLIVLFILTALSVVRKKKKDSPILSQIMQMQRSLACLIQWPCLTSLLMCVTKTLVVLVTRRCAMNYLPCLFLVYLLVGAFSKRFCFFIFALNCMFSKQ